jgi:hypothetical protein
MIIKRYIVFGFDRYYPNGGFNDCLGSYDSMEEIDEKIEKQFEYYTFNGFSRDEFQIFDCEERILISSVQGKPGFIR